MAPKDAFLHVSASKPDPFAGAELLLVTADRSFGDIHALMLSEKGRDKVHPLASEEELKSRRLGGENDSKRAYALTIVDEAGQRKVAAVIYTWWSRQAGKLPDDVEQILQEDSAPLGATADTVTFYSISSFMRGAGERLITALHKKLTSEHPGLTLTTLSPLRTLGAWVTENGDCGGDLKEAARQYLLANLDPVQKFHLSNGAYIGAINLDANHGDSADGVDGLGVMVNYVYPSDPAQLAANAARYKAGEVIFAQQSSSPRFSRASKKTPTAGIQ